MPETTQNTDEKKETVETPAPKKEAKRKLQIKLNPKKTAIFAGIALLLATTSYFVLHHSAPKELTQAQKQQQTTERNLTQTKLRKMRMQRSNARPATAGINSTPVSPIPDGSITNTPNPDITDPFLSDQKQEPSKQTNTSHLPSDPDATTSDTTSDDDLPTEHRISPADLPTKKTLLNQPPAEQKPAPTTKPVTNAQKQTDISNDDITKAISTDDETAPPVAKKTENTTTRNTSQGQEGLALLQTQSEKNPFSPQASLDALIEQTSAAPSSAPQKSYRQQLSDELAAKEAEVDQDQNRILQIKTILKNQTSPSTPSPVIPDLPGDPHPASGAISQDQTPTNIIPGYKLQSATETVVAVEHKGQVKFYTVGSNQPSADMPNIIPGVGRAVSVIQKNNTYQLVTDSGLITP